MNRIIVAAWLFGFALVAAKTPVFSQAPPRTVILDTTQNFRWVEPPQPVKSPDIQLLAFNPQTNNPDTPVKDSLTVSFFVPAGKSLVVEVRDRVGDDYYAQIGPASGSWPAAESQHLMVSKQELEAAGIVVKDLFFIGRTTQAASGLLVPIAINVPQTDSLTGYELHFKPNMSLLVDIEIKAGQGDEQTTIMIQQDEYYPGNKIWPLSWDANLNGQPYIEGLLTLAIRGRQKSGSTEKSFERSFNFYHIPSYRHTRHSQK